MKWLKRKWQTLKLNFRIGLYTEAMRNEAGMTHRWKHLSRERDRLINQRNQMLATWNLERNERRRG